jgi:hypothetical protein
MRSLMRTAVALIGTAALLAPLGATARATAESRTTQRVAVHGTGALSPLGDTVPGLTGSAARKLAGPAAAAFRALHARVRPSATTIHNAWGVFPPDSSGYKIMAHNSVVTGLTLSCQEYLYAPTVKAPSGSCAELTTAYTPSGAYLWAWDWCVADDVAKIVPLDAAFQSTYTTTVNGRPAYLEDEARTDAATNTWSIYLYNYTTSAWDTFYTQSGTDLTGVPYGWDTYEVYTTPASSGADGPYCAAIAGHAFETSGIELYTDAGGWSAATPSNAPGLDPIPPGSDFACSSLRFSVPSANSDWLAQH